MAIADKIQSIKTHIGQIYASLINKGVTVSGNKNLSNLKTIIDDIRLQDDEVIASYISLFDETEGEYATKLPDGITSIGDYIFSWEDSMFVPRFNSLPDSIESIGKNAFIGQRYLNLTGFLPANLAKLGRYAFQDSSVSFRGVNNVLEEISTCCFQGCDNMTYFEIPESASLTKINASAFKYSNLSPLVIRVERIITVSSNSFQDTPIGAGTGYIYVPDDLVDSYKGATNWSVYQNQIKGLSELPIEGENV